MDRKNHLIILWGGHYQDYSAYSAKFFLFSKGLVKCGSKVSIINNIALQKDVKTETFEGIDYYSIRQVRNFKFFQRLIANCSALLIFKQILNKANNNFLLISYVNPFIFFSFYILSKIWSVKIIISYMELHQSVKRSFGSIFFTQLAPKLSDGIIVISEYIKDYFENKGIKRTFKLPVLADYTKRHFPQNVKNDIKYFLYCGNAGYYEVIAFIIDAFNQIEECIGINLFLIINGNTKIIEKINEYICKTKKHNRIFIKSNVKQNELDWLMVNAVGLLAPLRPILQDIARFPNKIGEYTSSGRPIITNNCGEIKRYFTHMKNAYVCSDYSIVEYKIAMEWIINNENNATIIGQNGRLTGIDCFDYLKNSELLLKFLKHIG